MTPLRSLPERGFGVIKRLAVQLVRLFRFQTAGVPLPEAFRIVCKPGAGDDCHLGQSPGLLSGLTAGTLVMGLTDKDAHARQRRVRSLSVDWSLHHVFFQKGVLTPGVLWMTPGAPFLVAFFS